MSYKSDQRPLKNKSTKTMAERALILMQNGHELSELKGLTLGLGTSLRTRISELRKIGHDIKDKWEHSEYGSRYKVYFMEVV